MDTLRMIVFAAALPLGVAAAALVARSLLQRRAAGDADRSALPGAEAGPAVVLGFVAAWLGLVGAPRFPPTTRWHWLLAIAVIAAAAGFVEPRLGRRARWLVRVVLLPLVAWAIAAPDSALWIVVPAVALAAACGAFDALAADADARPFAAAAVVSGTAAAAAIVLSGWMSLGTVAGALAAAAGGVGLVALRRPVQTASAALPVSALLLGLLLAAVRWSELPVTAALCVGLAPLAAALVLANGRLRDRPPLRALASAAVTAAIAGAGVAVAVWTSPPLEY